MKKQVLNEKMLEQIATILVPFFELSTVILVLVLFSLSLTSCGQNPVNTSSDAVFSKWTVSSASTSWLDTGVVQPSPSDPIFPVGSPTWNIWLKSFDLSQSSYDKPVTASVALDDGFLCTVDISVINENASSGLFTIQNVTFPEGASYQDSGACFSLVGQQGDYSIVDNTMTITLNNQNVLTYTR